MAGLIGRSAGFPACGFTVLSSPVFRAAGRPPDPRDSFPSREGNESRGSGGLPAARNTGLESTVNPQAGKPALRPINPAIHRDLEQIDVIVSHLLSFLPTRSLRTAE